MSKNLTRKGLAIGALVALGTSVIAGAPAHAAGEINVAPAAGTSYNTIAEASFTLATTFAPGYAPAAYGQLKYLVKTDANSTVKFAASATRATAESNVAGATAQAVSTTSSAVAGGSSSATDVSYLALAAQTTTVSSSVEVTAFVDANNDGALTAGEWNTVRTVNFKKAADITPVVTLTAPSTGDTTVKATAVWGDLNVEQVTESVRFTVGSQITTATAGTLADGVWSLSATGLAAAEAVTAQAYIGSTALGTAVSGTAAARTINTTNGLVANVLKGDDALATAATTLTSTNTPVRANGSFTAQVKAYDTATTPVAKSGVAVVATVATTNTTLRPASTGVTEISVTVNGTKYTTNASLAAASVALTTDASGLASVVVSSTGLTAGTDTVTVSFKAQNLTASVVAAQTAASYTLSETTASGSTLRSIAEGGSTTLNYTVKDQFGVAISGGRLVTVVTPAGGSAVTTYTNLVGGAASFTVTDTTAITAASYAVSTTVETQNATTLNWAAASPAITASTQTVNVASQADAFDFAPAAASAAIATNATITGSVRNAGSAVVVSAKGVTFTVNSVEYADTVTIVTTSNGDFSFSAKSNTAGEKTITFTNTEVKTAVLTVAAAAPSTGATLTISAPTTSVPGRTVPVSVLLVDKYGNPVDTTSTTTDGQVTVTVSGIGTYTTVAADTDASGKVSFNVILPSNDSGSVVISAKYDSNGATADVAGTTVVLSSTATITVAAAAVVEPTSKIGTANARVYVNVKDGKGSVVTVKIGAKWFTRSALNNDYTLSFKSVKGKKVSVKVYVDGDLSSSKTITVK